MRRTRSPSPPARGSTPSVQIASEENIQREDGETIQTWKSSLPNSVNLNTLARWSHSSGHVDANMAKVLTLYALLGGHPNNTSSYVMRMGVRLADRGSAMNGKTAISTLIAIVRALRASESKVSEPDILREIYRRNACEQLFPPDKNPDFGLAGTWESPHWQAFDAMNIWTRHKRLGRSYFHTLPKLTADPVVHADNTFRSDDLNIYALKNAGKLDIRWTDRVEDHLLLWLGGNVDDDASDSFDSSSGSNSNYRHFNKPTLEIYWFDFKHYAWLAR